jgi:SHS2 domain-containing protein
MNYHFEEIEHTADIAIRIRGRDLAELFVNAAYGMACQLSNPDAVKQTVERRIELDAYDAETLLVSWLGERPRWSCGGIRTAYQGGHIQRVGDRTH